MNSSKPKLWNKVFEKTFFKWNSINEISEMKILYEILEINSFR